MRALLVTTLVLAALPACTRLLGLDGEYTVDENASGGSTSGEPGSGGNANRVAASGGSPAEQGGAPSTGAVRGATDGAAGADDREDSGDSGAAPGVDAGDEGASATPVDACTDCDAAPALACKEGRYEGAFDGTYNPTTNPILTLPVNLPVSGKVQITLVRRPGGAILDATGIILGADIATQTTGVSATFAGRTVGTLDCETKKYIAMLLDGEFAVGSFVIKFGGNTQGDYEDSAISGEWSEFELTNTSNVPNASGTFYARWVGP